MLRYQGKAIVFDGKGNSLPEKGYDVQVEVLDAVDGRIRFGEEKRFSNGFGMSGEFEFDLKGRPAQFPEKGISVVYINMNECFGEMSIQGASFSLAATVDFSSIRNVLFNQEMIYVETLTPLISDLGDLSHEEILVCAFVREKASKILDVRSIILFGSRSMRSHHSESDFDFAIDAVGKRSDWLALADCVRNEAPTLCEIQIVELSHRLKWEFVASVYRNGRFIYG
ncbi:MAG: polymerase beta, Nucleotidyltransferase [Pseudomonadota bacterium]|jgi:predicted nucleotidyltransferase